MKRSLRWLHYGLLRVHRYALKKPLRMIALTVLVLFFFSVHITKLRTILAMEDVVDQSFKSKQHLMDLQRDFNLGSSMNLIVQAPAQGWTETLLCQIHAWLLKQKMESTDILSTFSVFDIRSTKNDSLHLSYPRMLPLSCMSDHPQKPLERDALQKLLRKIYASPFGNQVVSSNLTVNVQIDLYEDSENSRTGSFNPIVVANRQASFDEQVGKLNPDLQYYWVGSSDLQHYLFTGLKRVNVLNGLLVLALLIAFRSVFGSWRSGLIYTSSLILTAVTCLGAMAFWGEPMDILSKSLFLMIAVAALEDFLYLSFLRMGTKSWRAPFRELMLPGFLTSFTTALGFGSLMISDLQIIQRFGFWVALASMLEWFLVFVILPAMMQVFPRLRCWTSSQETSLLRWLKFWKIGVPSYRWVRVSLLFFPLAIAGFLVLNVNDVPSEMFPAEHRYRQGLSVLERSFQWQAQVSLVFDGTTVADRSAILQTLSRHPLISHIIDPEKILIWYQQGVVNSSTRTLIEAEVKSAKFFENFFSAGGRERAVLLIRQMDSTSVGNLTEVISELCQGKHCHVTGLPVIYAEFSNLVPKTLLESFLLSVVLVVLILGWVAGSVGQWRSLGPILVSSFWGLCVMFSIIGFFQLKVNFLTCVFASVLVGLTGDNAIQFLCSRRSDMDTACVSRGEPALLCGVLMTLCSLIFLGSYFIPPRLFGLLLAGGFLMSMIGDYWVLRSLLKGTNK